MFLAFSPRQPGIKASSTRASASLGTRGPVYSARVYYRYGDGDSTCDPGPEPGSCIGDTPFGRRIGFQRMPATGNKYQLYIHDADAFHTLFELNAEKCAT